jgi:hypothetical protein
MGQKENGLLFAERNESMSFTNAQVVFTEEDGEE